MADPKSPEFKVFAERYLWAADDFDTAEEMDALRAFAAQDMEMFERAAARVATLAVVERVRRRVLDATEAGRNVNDNELMYRLLYQIEREAKEQQP